MVHNKFLLKNQEERQKSLNIFARVQIGMWIRFQSEYANLAVCEEMSCYTEFFNEKQDESEQEIFQDKSFI